MKWLFLTLVLLPTQDKTVTLKGLVMVTAPGVPSAPVLLGVK